MFSYKIVMIGDFGVGKTSLVNRFVDNSFSEDYLSTIGVCISKKLLTLDDGTKSTMMLWDIEGKTEYKPIFKQYLLGAKAFIVVADLTRVDTIDSIKQHLKICDEVVKDAPICVALNKSDLEIRDIISIESIKELSENIVKVYKTSAKSGDAVNEIFNILNQTIIKSSK